VTIEKQLRDHYSSIGTNPDAESRLRDCAASIARGPAPTEDHRTGRAKRWVWSAASVAAVLLVVATAEIWPTRSGPHRSGAASAGPSKSPVRPYLSGLPADQASAVQKFLTLCKVDGDAAPTNVELVQSTAEAAETHIFGDDSYLNPDSAQNGQADVFVITGQGNFVDNADGPTPGQPTESGHYVTEIILVGDGSVIDTGFGSTPPPPLDKLGSVVNVTRNG
jgi:hypothetical protein